MDIINETITDVIQSATISDVHYRKCVFKNTSMVNVTFVNCNFDRCAFVRCMLRNVNFINCFFERLDCIETTWTYCDLSTCKIDVVDHQVYILSIDSRWPAEFVQRYNIIPENREELTGWKYCAVIDINNVALWFVLVELSIPADAQVSNGFSRKCRASKAVVKKIHHIAQPDKFDRVVSWWDHGVEYREGDTLVPYQPFDKNRTTECASGIHFFLTKEEARQWAEYQI